VAGVRAEAKAAHFSPGPPICSVTTLPCFGALFLGRAAVTAAFWVAPFFVGPKKQNPNRGVNSVGLWRFNTRSVPAAGPSANINIDFGSFKFGP
jgi:hypothetical protein